MVVCSSTFMLGGGGLMPAQSEGNTTSLLASCNLRLRIPPGRVILWTPACGALVTDANVLLAANVTFSGISRVSAGSSGLQHSFAIVSADSTDA